MIPEACRWSRPRERDGSMFHVKEGNDPSPDFLYPLPCHKVRRFRPMTELPSAQVGGRFAGPMGSVRTSPGVYPSVSLTDGPHR